MSRTAIVLAALLALAVAIVLRFVGQDELVPCFVEPDAHIAIQVDLIESGDPEPSKTIDYGKYPHLVAWTTIALTPTPVWGSLAEDAPLEEHLALAAAPFTRVRWAVAFLSLLALPATWLLARLYLPRGGALVAVWLATTSLLAVHFATQGRPHGAAVGFFAFAVVSAVVVRRRADVPAYLMASVACALCFGTLQSGIATYGALAVAHWLAGPLKSRRHWKLVFPALGFGLAILLLYPFWVFGAEADGGSVQMEGSRLNQAGHLIMLHGFNGKGFPVLARALFSWEPVLALGLVAGLLLWISDRVRRRPGALGWPDHLVVLGFVLPYAAMISLYQRSYERFLLPLLPFLCVLAAWAFWRALRPAPGGSRKLRILSAAVAAVLLATPALIAGRLVQVRSAPDTYHQAADWLRTHQDPERDRLSLMMPLILPLWSTPEALAAAPLPKRRGRGMFWLYYQMGLADAEQVGDAAQEGRPEPDWDLRWMPLQRVDWRKQIAKHPRTFARSLDAEYAVIEVYERGRMDPIGGIVRRALQEHAELVARFGPEPDPYTSPTPLTYQDETGGSVPFMAARLLGAERMGAVLEIYELPERPERNR